MSKHISTNSCVDIYQRVTDTIVRDLERGARPWVKPWTSTSTASNAVIRPLRHDSTPYRGIHVLILWAEAAEHGYTLPTWMTYRQTQALGAQVRKGERGTTIVYAKTIQRSEEDSVTGEDTLRTIPLLRSYTVFNADQVDGLPAHYSAEPDPQIDTTDVSGRIDRADAFVAETGAIIQHRGNRASYIPSADRIEMPPYGQFCDTPTSTAADAYYATLLHELVHNAVILIMPRNHPRPTILRGSATRRFGIIRGLPGTRVACHRVGIGSVMLASPQHAPALASSVASRHGCRPAWSRRIHVRARVR